MRVDVQTEIVIDRPIEVVAAYAADPTNAPGWYAKLDSVEWKTVPSARVGSKVAFVARFLGRRLAYTYELVEVVPGERLVMRTTEGPFPMETTYTWTPLGDKSTRMTLRNRGDPSGFSRVMALFMAPAIRSANRKDLVKIKRFSRDPERDLCPGCMTGRQGLPLRPISQRTGGKAEYLAGVVTQVGVSRVVDRTPLPRSHK